MPRLKSIGLCVVAFLIALIIFVVRVPGWLQQPNFYGEDGWYNILRFEQSPLSLLRIKQNGWHTLGTFVLVHASTGINKLIFGGIASALPISNALTSYAFWAFIAIAPILLFWRYLSPAWKVLLFLLNCFAPLSYFDHAIIGTLCNTKFLFGYLGVLLTVWRLITPASSCSHTLSAAALVVCAYSCPSVFGVLACGLAMEWFRCSKTPYLWAGWLIAVLGGARQLWILFRLGIPHLDGYSNVPVVWNNIVETFTAKTYLFAFAHPFYRSLNNPVSIALTVGGIYLLTKTQRHRVAILLLLGFAGLLTLAAVWQRPIITRPGGYAWHGPRQYFIAQNLLVYVALALAASTWTHRVRTLAALIAAITITLNIGPAFRTRFPYADWTPLAQYIQAHCKTERAQTMIVPTVTLGHTSFPIRQACATRGARRNRHARLLTAFASQVLRKNKSAVQ